jgi:hypothetical protein
MLVRFQVLTAENIKLTVFWAIALMMEAASTSETSVKFYQIMRRNVPGFFVKESTGRQSLSHQT